MSKEKQLLAAQAELAKHGIALKVGFGNTATKSDMLAERANLRRGINALNEDARAAMDAGDSKRAEQVMGAIDACAEMVNGISARLDLDESATAFGGSASANRAESILRDQSGDRIGVLLDSTTLRDESAIARKIGAQRNGAGIDDGAESMSLTGFFRGVAGMRTTEAVRAALSEGTGASGGYAVPTILMPGILNALVPASSLLTAGANVAVLDTQASSFKVAGIDTIPTAAWRSESGNVVESDPAFRSITITPRSLAFRFKLSRELLQDAPGLDTALQVAIAQAFAVELDRAGLRGSGTAPEIRGLLNILGVNAITNGADGAALKDYGRFINAARAIKEANAPAPNAAIMSPREDETVALFADTTGQPLRRPDALAPWQFLTSSQIPTDLTVGTSDDCGEIYVGDFSRFTYFMRESVSVQLLHELYAGTGELGFICHTRVDVAAAYPKAFAVITGVRPGA